MADTPTLKKGERYDTRRLVEMGVLPSDFLREVEQWPVISVVANVDHETRTVTFDSLPQAGGMWAEEGGPSAHKSIHDYQEQLKAKRKRRKARR